MVPQWFFSQCITRLHGLLPAMKRFLLVAVLLLAALPAMLSVSAAQARSPSQSPSEALDRPDPTVKAILPGCRSLLHRADAIGLEEAGLCSGVVDSLLYIGELLPVDYRSCVPLRLARHDILQAIVEDLDALSPEFDRQNFKGMVLEILHYRWPCRD